MKSKMILSLALLPFTTSAAAQIDLEGLYVGTTLSSYSYDIDSSYSNALKTELADFGSVDTNDSDGGYQLKMGYRINDYFAVELGYLNLGTYGHDVDVDMIIDSFGIDVNVTGPANLNEDVTGATLNITANYPITEQLNAYGRVGVFSWEVKRTMETRFTATAFGESSTESDSQDLGAIDGEDAYFGLGMAYSFDYFDLLAEYERYAIEQVDVSSFNLGFVFHF